MNCSNCGTKNKTNASFCTNCGLALKHVATIQPQTVIQPYTPTETVPPSPNLVGFGWLIFIGGFITGFFGGGWFAFALLCNLFTLVIAIVLIASKNKSNKLNGKVLLVIWLILFSITFIISYNNAQQARTNQINYSQGN